MDNYSETLEGLMSIFKKIQNCRAAIKASDLKKTGHNEYSNYDYYTPEQVNKLVYDACLSEGLLNKFSLIRNEHGLHGWLKVIDIESGESEAFQAATEMPVITATNASQQMGGCMTFSERYLKMTVYEIVDNNLDFDSQKPPKAKKGKHTGGDNFKKDNDYPAVVTKFYELVGGKNWKDFKEVIMERYKESGEKLTKILEQFEGDIETEYTKDPEKFLSNLPV